MRPKPSELDCPSANEIDRHVGAQIKRLRTENKLTMVDIAQAIGVTYQQIQKYEEGTNRVSVRMLYRLALFFKVPVTAFYDGLEAEKDTLPSDQPIMASQSGYADMVDDAQSLLRVPLSVRGPVVALIKVLATSQPRSTQKP